MDSWFRAFPVRSVSSWIPRHRLIVSSSSRPGPWVSRCQQQQTTIGHTILCFDFCNPATGHQCVVNRFRGKQCVPAPVEKPHSVARIELQHRFQPRCRLQARDCCAGNAQQSASPHGQEKMLHCCRGFLVCHEGWMPRHRIRGRRTCDAVQVTMWPMQMREKRRTSATESSRQDRIRTWLSKNPESMAASEHK